MASPRGAYTPKSGALAGQEFASYYQYQNARARELGFRDYGNQRDARLNERVREVILRIYPNYPPDRLSVVMAKANKRQKNDIAHFETIQDAYEWPDAEEVGLFYH